MEGETERAVEARRSVLEHRAEEKRWEKRVFKSGWSVAGGSGICLSMNPAERISERTIRKRGTHLTRYTSLVWASGRLAL